MKKLIAACIALGVFILPSALIAQDDRGIQLAAAEILGTDAAIGKQWAVFIAITARAYGS
jgi:hypothetical protein